MRKWAFTVIWTDEVEAEDEGMALIEADSRFNFMSEVRAEEVNEYDDEN